MHTLVESLSSQQRCVCVFAQCTPGLGVCSFVYLFGYFECIYNMQLCRPFDACNSILNKLHPQ